MHRFEFYLLDKSFERTKFDCGIPPLNLFLTTQARHDVEDVREAIGLPNSVAGRNQARNILVRLSNEGDLRRVERGVYERARKVKGRNEES